MRCIASKKDPSEVLVLSNVFFYSEIFFGIDVRFFFFFFFLILDLYYGACLQRGYCIYTNIVHGIFLLLLSQFLQSGSHVMLGLLP